MGSSGPKDPVCPAYPIGESGATLLELVIIQRRAGVHLNTKCMYTQDRIREIKDIQALAMIQRRVRIH